MNAGRHFWGIDVVRFAAAALVTTFHLAYWSWYSPNDTAALASGGRTRFPELAPWTWFGWVGVEIFFVISGVVIAFSAAHATPKTFAASRIARLYPAAWICGSLSLAVALLIGMGSPGELLEPYLRTLLLMPFGPWIDGVYWTLAVEMVFYLLVFSILGFWNYDTVEPALWCVGFASAFYWVAMVLGDVPISIELANLLLLRHGAFFALGVTIWMTATRGASGPRIAAMIVFCLICSVEIASVARQRGVGLTASAPPWLTWCLAVVGIAVSVLSRERALARPRIQAVGRRLGLMT